MATPVELPKLGNTVEECIIAKWRKKKGDAVSAGDVVVDIETDKATFEVPAPVNGTLLETFFEEGALAPVFTNLFVIGEPGESVDPFRPTGGPAPGPAAGPPAGSVVQARNDGEGAASGPGGPPHNGNLTPRARRFAEEHKVHASSFAGSGPGGRVLEEDVRRAYYRGAPAAPAPAPRAASIREKIARRMRESLASTAQYTLNSSADATGLLTLRARIKASATPDININDLVSFCTIEALRHMPALNATFIDGKIQQHPEIHMGFAVDTPRGLIVPVVKNAHSLPIAELAAQIKTLAAHAIQGNISPDDLSGATFTISNLGGLGIESFTPLLNPPQVAILGVDAIQVKPVRKLGKVEFIDAIGLSLTCDHQVIDGAPGARFLQILKEKIENVESLCTI